MSRLAEGVAESRSRGAYNEDALPLAEAKRIVLGCAQPGDGIESVPLREALERVLAEDLRSSIAVPGEACAAMDGWALRAEDAGKTLKPIGTAFAGRPFAGKLGEGECVRIMTGAVIPDGADCVVMQEHASVDGGAVKVPPGQRAGQHCRPAGEDLARGQLALPAGKRMGPAEIALAASLGAVTLAVRVSLRVAFFSSGDELTPLGRPLPRGGVYDSNRHMLWALLARLGCETIDLGVVRDDPAALEKALSEGAARADAVISTGGAADGDADFTKRIAASLGEVAFWKLALRPGRPFAFGVLKSGEREALFFGLPGNPVAAITAFWLLVRPALLRLAGCRSIDPPLVMARLLEPVKKRVGREEYLRATIEPCADSELGVRFTPAQGAASLLSLAQAECLVRLPADVAGVEAGERVEILLMDSLA